MQSYFQAIMKQYPDKLKRSSLVLIAVNPWRLLNLLDYNNGVCRLASTTLYSGRGFLSFFVKPDAAVTTYKASGD